MRYNHLGIDWSGDNAAQGIGKTLSQSHQRLADLGLRVIFAHLASPADAPTNAGFQFRKALSRSHPDLSEITIYNGGSQDARFFRDNRGRFHRAANGAYEDRNAFAVLRVSQRKAMRQLPRSGGAKHRVKAHFIW